MEASKLDEKKTIDIAHETLKHLLHDPIKNIPSIEYPDLPPNLLPIAKIVNAGVNDFPLSHEEQHFFLSFEKSDPRMLNVFVGQTLFGIEEAVTKKHQLKDFSEEQLEEFTSRIVLSKDQLSVYDNIPGVVTWAEGCFRQKTNPSFHAHLRFDLKCTQQLPLNMRNFLIESWLHSYDYSFTAVYCKLQPADLTTATNIEITAASKPVEELSDEEVQQTLSLKVTPYLYPNGTPTNLFWLRRPFDNFAVAVWDDLRARGGEFNVLWHPKVRAAFRASTQLPGSYYKHYLPAPESLSTVTVSAEESQENPNTEKQYFYLYGFDDREKEHHRGTLSDEARFRLPNTKYLYYDDHKTQLQLSKDVSQAAIFMEDAYHTLYLVKRSKKFTETTATGKEGEGEGERKREEEESYHKILSFLNAHPSSKEANKPFNRYFRDDLQAVLTARDQGKYPRDRVSLEAQWEDRFASRFGHMFSSLREFLQSLVLHPFLPIIGFKYISTADTAAESHHPGTNVTRSLLLRMQILEEISQWKEEANESNENARHVFRARNNNNNNNSKTNSTTAATPFGCEMVILVHLLRKLVADPTVSSLSAEVVQSICSSSVGGIPGYDFLPPRTRDSQWTPLHRSKRNEYTKEGMVIGYCWMLPVTFFTHPLVTLLEDHARYREFWLEKFQKKGKFYQVMS